MSNPYQNAVKQLEEVSEILKKDSNNIELIKTAIENLKTPDQVFEFDIPVEMDDGSQRIFKGFRSQHNNARGPYKGGIRFHPDVSLDEVKALSMWMTWKSATTNIPYGGGKGGIIVNPKKMSNKELEKLSRGYVRALYENIGPWIDIPAPDVNTNSQIMAWMVDEYQKLIIADGMVSENPLAAFTGKPLELGGSEGRTEATGLGGAYILEKVIKQLGKKKNEIRIAVQGFGNVGFWFSKHAFDRGYKIVALSDSKGGIFSENGLNPNKVLDVKKQEGSVLKYSGHKDVEVVDGDKLLELDVDILVPSALENVINKDNVNRIKADIIIELANGPVTPQADKELFTNDKLVVPDVLANAGGVTTSYLEWVQNLQGFYWSKDKVLSKLKPLMEIAFDHVWQIKQEKKTSFRMAAYVKAVKSVIETMILRGDIS